MSLARQSNELLPTHVQVTVIQAKELKSKGKAGTNDAYAFIQLGKEKFLTSVVEKSVNPVWKEEASFELPILQAENQERCTVRITVMHRAVVGMDKFLGQVEINLWEKYQGLNRKPDKWYPLKSKPGKKEKNRGQIQVDVLLQKNRMSSSMFDLSTKEKSRSTLGKLKSMVRGKRQDGLSDSASAIVPSMNQYGHDSDEEVKKKPKLKNLLSKPRLNKNISQSMSVLPTQPPSPSQRSVLKPADFSSNLSLAEGSEALERQSPNISGTLTHKRTASADPSQVKSFFTGMRPKNEPVTQSNLCINGSHVYTEEYAPRGDRDPKTNSLSSSTSQIFLKNLHYGSAENLSSKATKENTSNNLPDKGTSSSNSSSSLKSLELNATENMNIEPISKRSPLASDIPKEAKESKKQENKVSALLSLVTGRKDTPKTERSAGESTKKEESKETNSVKSLDRETKSSLNTSEENKVEEKTSEPLPPERNAKTFAVKPRLEVSSEAETKARLSSSSLSPSSSLAASSSGGQIATPNTDESSNISPYSSHSLDEGPSLPGNTKMNKGSAESITDFEKPSMPLFWSSRAASNKLSEPKQSNIVAPVTEKNNAKKTYVKSLLDQLKGKSTEKDEENVVDVDLVRGILPVLTDASPIHEEPPSFLENNLNTKNADSNQEDTVFTSHNGNNDDMVSSEIKEKSSVNVNEVPKPNPRVQSVATKEEPKDVNLVPPKPAPRSAKLNKTKDSVSDGTSVQAAQTKTRSSSEYIVEKVSGVGALPFDHQVQTEQIVVNIKMVTPLIEDELPVILEYPEGTSDDEQLDIKNNKSHPDRGLGSSVKKAHDSETYEEDSVIIKVREKSSIPLSDNVMEYSSDKADISDIKVKYETSDSTQQPPADVLPSTNTYPTPSLNSVSSPTKKPNPSRAAGPTIPTIDGSAKVESSGKKKLLQARVSPSETHPIPTVQSGGAVSSRQRTNPVKPYTNQNSSTPSNFSQPIKSSDYTQNSINTKKYDSSDPASAYAQLTHDELIQLVLKQKDIINKKEGHIQEMENYIDNLLVRVMEETPNILLSVTKHPMKGKF